MTQLHPLNLKEIVQKIMKIKAVTPGLDEQISVLFLQQRISAEDLSALDKLLAEIEHVRSVE